MVPFWGDPQMLYETVRSVQAQTDSDWLLTVVDDAYPDESVAEYFAGLDDERITYVRQAVNVGITDNYRYCVSRATQELVVLLGCDDVMLPNYVEVVMAAHRAHPDVDVIQPGVQVVDQDGRVSKTLVDSVKQRISMPRADGPTVFRGEELAASLLRSNWMYWPSLAFRRDRLVATPFREDFPLIQDLALVVDMVMDGAALLVEPTLCFSYRRHSASASSATLLDGRRFEGERRYFRLAEELASERGWRRAAREARCHLTSRAHALTLIPTSIRANGTSGARALVHHVVSR